MLRGLPPLVNESASGPLLPLEMAPYVAIQSFIADNADLSTTQIVHGRNLEIFATGGDARF